ncbi:MAG: SUF system NifU family Fe-S cluster assembly protein [Tepidiformaceae bacterium]
MAELFDDLYRELILDHYRQPRNHGELPDAPIHVEGVNPVCGDEIHIDLDVADGSVKDVSFWGQGCSISQSSASMLTERVKGRPLAEVERVTGKVRAMLIDGALPDNDLGDLEALEGVAKLPVRVKCALLCWNVLEQGLREAATTA